MAMIYKRDLLKFLKLLQLYINIFQMLMESNINYFFSFYYTLLNGG